MELRNRDGNLFANVAKVNNVYSVGLNMIPPRSALAACTTDGLDKVTMVATAKGADGIRATLLTWHRRLGHPSFKTMVALAESGANGMVITDLPEKICVRCMCRSESSTLPALRRRIPGSSTPTSPGNAGEIG